MNWAEMKIQQYKKGQNPSFLERISLEHANPVNFAFHVLGAIPIIYGLWIHHLGLIFVGILLNLIGHIYCRLKK